MRLPSQVTKENNAFLANGFDKKKGVKDVDRLNSAQSKGNRSLL